MAKKQKNSSKWFIIGVVAALLAAPNAAIIKATVSDIDPFAFNALRSGLLLIILLPFVVRYIPKMTKQNVKDSLISGVCIAAAITSFVWAIKLSQASYVTIASLISPIVFVLYSTKMTGEKISSRALAGITLAALGAFTIIALPLAFAHDASFTFYPLATAILSINILLFPLATIYTKKAHDGGLPLTGVIGVSTIVSFILTAAAALVIGGGTIATMDISAPHWLSIAYSVVAVSFIARFAAVASYEHVGSATTSAIAYFGTFVAIIISVLFLDEKISIGIVAGGVLILLGVYLTEKHHIKYHLHFHSNKHS